MPVSNSTRICDVFLPSDPKLPGPQSVTICSNLSRLNPASLSLTRGILLGRIGYALAMPSALFILPRVFPMPPLSAALAHHCDRRGGDGKVLRCGRYRLHRRSEPQETGRGNKWYDDCAHE